MQEFHPTSIALVVGGGSCWSFVVKDGFIKKNPLTGRADDSLDLDLVSQGVNRQFLTVV